MNEEVPVFSLWIDVFLILLILLFWWGPHVTVFHLGTHWALMWSKC